MGKTDLTGAELIFAQRMLPHFMAGKSVAVAAEAVLADDARLFSAFVDDSHQYQGFNDASHTYTNVVAKGIASELSARVYRELRA